MAKNKKAKTKKITIRRIKSAKKPPHKIKKPAVKKQEKITIKKISASKVIKPAAAVFPEPTMDKKELGFYKDKLVALKDEILNQKK